MSIDAMNWVWEHSRTKGNVRLIVLAVADKAPGPDCTARMGMTEFMRRVNAARSTVMTAVDKALESGELVMIEDAIGTRAALYHLPKAVGYVRSAPSARGPESGPVEPNYRTESRPPTPNQGTGIRPGSENTRGPESGPEGTENRPSRGPESGPHHQTTPTRSASKQESPTATPDLGPEIPAASRPLVDALTAAGVVVRWNLTVAEWFTVEALIAAKGLPALATYAQRQAAARDISYARYFLGGWRDLPPLPQPGTDRPALRAVPGGWQPYTNPVDHSVYENGF